MREFKVDDVLIVQDKDSRDIFKIQITDVTEETYAYENIDNSNNPRWVSRMLKENFCNELVVLEYINIFKE